MITFAKPIEAEKDIARTSTVLIVDDVPANLDVLRQILEPEGYRLAFATTGEKAIEIVNNAPPDLILLDVMMPGIDGYATCRQLKINPAHADIPVIFVTARTSPKDVVAGFEAGGADYIPKPFHYEEVLARTRLHLQIRHLVAEIKTKNGKLTELNEIKNRFLGIAAHDLRNPASSILGFSELLLNQGGTMEDETRKKFLGIIHRTSREMLTLINDLLDVAVIESGKLTLTRKKGSLKTFLEDRLKLNAYLAGNKRMPVRAELADTPDFRFDPDRIGQVFDNLFSNAVKYSPSGSEIHVRLEGTGGWAKVAIHDQGPGLSDEDKSRLFGEFQKLSAAPTGGEKSTGLGLAIVKKIIETHGGRLEVDSAPGAGSTFSFSLPLKPA